MANKAKLIEVLDYGLGEVRSFVDNLSAEQRMEIGAVDRWSAKDVLAHFTEWVTRLVSDFPEIREIDLNPVRVRAAGQGCLALDARMLLGVPPPG